MIAKLTEGEFYSRANLEQLAPEDFSGPLGGSVTHETPSGPTSRSFSTPTSWNVIACGVRTLKVLLTLTVQPAVAQVRDS